ncbi:MAG: hypothetical protein K6E18_06580 [Lachnospiraceae bacterium]|nr:hypothetical protein [Lachnospiraceae bacterium]
MKQWLGRFFQMSDVLDELLCGILLYGLVCQAGLLLFQKAALYHSIGLWIGIVLAVLGAFHITWTLDKILDLGAEDAVKKSRSYAVLRYGLVLIVLGILMIVNRANPLTAFLGLMGLKAGAYIQPTIHKAAVKMGLKQEIQKPLLTPEEVDELIAAEKGKKKEQKQEQEVQENE